MIEQPGEEVDAWARAVIGAAIEVHKILGPGLLEKVYEGGLAAEMRLRDIPFEQQVPVPMIYKGEVIGEGRLDFLVAGVLVVELKTVDTLAPVHMAQVLSYLKATGKQLGVLMNFNVNVLKNGLKRVVLTQQPNP